MNIDALSEMTLEKFIDKGFITEYADLFRLDRYKEEIVGMEGMGVKSYENLMDSVNSYVMVHFIYKLNLLGGRNVIGEEPEGKGHGGGPRRGRGGFGGPRF